MGMCLQAPLLLGQHPSTMPRGTRIICMHAQELSRGKKMCHTIDSEDALLELQAAAKREGVPTRIVVDEGMGHNKTVLAMGPASEQVLLQLLHGLAEL